MAESLLSPAWYRVAQLRPRIRSHSHFHRHRYRGRTWWVLRDGSSGRCHRLSEAAYALTALMDGSRTTHEIWEAACERFGDDAPTQGEAIRLLGMLDFANALQCDVSPDTEALLRRIQRREQIEWWRRFTNPISIRIPLWNPDPFLTRHVHLVAPLFGPLGAGAAALAIAFAGLLALVHREALASAGAEQIFDPLGWLLLALFYPLVKMLHELGHGFAAKVWGGEVHEMGVLLLAFVPLPYVDASSAAVFPERSRRAAVGAAGIVVELFLASLALFVWLLVSPGLVSSASLAVMLLCGVSTLLFNGNPLLRYDGYYVLADLIEIPNLHGRAQQYIGYLVKTHGLGLDNARRPVVEKGEEKWLVGYGLASWIYRVFILLAIALFLADRFFVVGVALALFAVIAQLVVPLARQLGFLLADPQLHGRRTSATARAAAAAAALAALVFWVPLPLSTTAQGVVWPGQHAQVRSQEEGFVSRLLVTPGSHVEAGEPLIETHDAGRQAERLVLAARLDELQTKLHAQQYTDRAQAEITLQELGAVEASLRRTEERAEARTLRAPSSGRFVLATGEDLTGRLVRQGQLLAYVLGERLETVRVVVPQEDVALVRGGTESVAVRAAGRIDRVLPATVRSEVPGAVAAVPARALGALGGGPFAVDPADDEGLRVEETLFQLDLQVPADVVVGGIGERIYVRFDHGSEPLGWRAYRNLRRLLLRRLDV